MVQREADERDEDRKWLVAGEPILLDTARLAPLSGHPVG
jgi:hypothetical protein